MAKTTLSLSAKVAFLKIPPQAWDARIPHSLRFSQTAVEYWAAGVVRDIGHLVHDATLRSKLASLGREMVGAGAKGLIQGFDDGDDICPPWPPFPPFPWPGVGPVDLDPVPWKTGIVEQVVLADMLLSLAGVTTHADYSTQLRELAIALVKSASQQIVDDFQKAAVHPRMITAK
jgi:hypothetical protein